MRVVVGLVVLLMSSPVFAADAVLSNLEKDEETCLQQSETFAVFGECIKKASLKLSKRSKPRDEQKEFFAMIDGLSAQTTRGEIDNLTAAKRYLDARAEFAVQEKTRLEAKSNANPVGSFFSSLGFGPQKSAFNLDADENTCLQRATSFSVFGSCIKAASLRQADRSKPRYEQKDFFIFIDQLSAETDAGTTDIQSAMNRYLQARQMFQQSEANRWAVEEQERQQALARNRAQAAAEEAANNDPFNFTDAPSGPIMIQNTGSGSAIINQPGQLPTTVQKFGNGLIINTPGQAPTTIQSFGNGAIINTPGQMPSTVTPMGKNGAIINTPGQMPTIVNQMGNTTTLTKDGKQTTCIKTGNMVTCN